MLWWPNNEILKISNFGRGKWLWPNDHLFRPWLKEKRCYFCKDFSYGHDLHINRMWKWLFWRPNSGNLKAQNFGRGRSEGQNDHYLRSYMTQKTLELLYELLHAHVSKNKRMVKWLYWCLNSETLSKSNSGWGRLLFLSHHYVMPYFQKALGKDRYNVFSILKEIFVTVLTLFANFISSHFDKVKSSNLKVNHQQLTPRLTITFR